MIILYKNLIIYISKYLPLTDILSLSLTCTKFYKYMKEIIRFNLNNLPKNLNILFNFKNLRKLNISEFNPKRGYGRFKKSIIIPENIKKININLSSIKLFKYPDNIDKLLIVDNNDRFKVKYFRSYLPKNIRYLKIIPNSLKKKKIKIDYVYMNKNNIEKLECRNYYFNKLPRSTKYAICGWVENLLCPIEYIHGIYINNLKYRVKTFEIIEIFRFMAKADFRNIDNIIFNNVEIYPESNYLFNKNHNITFINCSE